MISILTILSLFENTPIIISSSKEISTANETTKTKYSNESEFGDNSFNIKENICQKIFLCKTVEM